MMSGIGNTFRTCLQVCVLGAFVQSSLFAVEMTHEEGLEALLFLDLPIVNVASKRDESISEAPGIVTVVTAREMETFGASNLRDVFDRMPSMQVIGSQMVPETVVSIRAQAFFHENNHVLMLINGRPFRESLSQGYSATLIGGMPIEVIDRIEVIRGPGSVLYGSGAFSGVINIITKSPEARESVFVSGAAGNLNTTKVDTVLSMRGEDAGLVLAAKHYKSDGWNMEFIDQLLEFHDFETDEEDTGIYLDAYYKNLRLRGFFGELYQTALQPPGFGPLRTHYNRNVFFDLSYEHDITDSWKIQTFATYNFFDYGELELASEDILAEITVLGNISESTEVVLGFTYQNLDFDSPENFIQADVFKSEQPLSAYAQLGYRLTENTKIVGGLQYNKPVDTEDGISPRIALMSNLSDKWSVKVLHGEAFRSPNFLENYILSPNIIYGNPDLDPETVTTTELQLNYRSEKFISSLTFYHSVIEDLITRVGFPINYTNGGPYGDVDFDGVEFESKVHLSDSFVLHGNFTYQQNENDYGIEGVTFTPEFMAKLGLTYESSSGVIRAGIFDSYFGEPTDEQDMVPHFVPFIPILNPQSEAYHLVTCSVRVDVNRLFNLDSQKSIALSLFIDNLLDEEINFPDINAQHVNSYPIHSSRAGYVALSVEY